MAQARLWHWGYGSRAIALGPWPQGHSLRLSHDPPPPTGVEMICFCISERGRCHQAHLLLTGENISRTTWLAARMLGKDPEAAQAAAAELRTHLCSVAPAKRTSFEATFFEDADLYANLERFADEAPPNVVWMEGPGPLRTTLPRHSVPREPRPRATCWTPSANTRSGSGSGLGAAA